MRSPERTYIAKLLLLLALAWPLASVASPQALTYQGRILKSDGTPMESNNVSFQFQVMDPQGLCTVYKEQVDGIDMSNSKGVFDVPIGGGTVSWPNGGGFFVLDAFNNSAALPCVGGSSSYTPLASDGRVLRVQFYDGSGWKLITPDSVIRSVPFAGYASSAAKLGNNLPTDFVLKTAVAACPANNFLTYDGTGFSCAPVTGASGGTVTVVSSANSYLSVANGTSNPSLTLNVGTTANTVAAGNDSRIVNAMPSGISAGGDLSGSLPNPTVAKLQGVAVSSVAPVSSGQALRFDGTQWVGASLAIGDISNLSTTLSSYLSQAAFNAYVASANCAANETMYWNSVSGNFQCKTINVSMAGDVSGSLGATSVDKIKGVLVDTTAPTSGQVLKYNGTKWAPAADNNTGGSVTTVSSANSYLSVANGSSTPTLTVNVGTAANTVAAGNDSRIVNAIQNAGNAASMVVDTLGNRPVVGAVGAIYVATDGAIYTGTGAAWNLVSTKSASLLVGQVAIANGGTGALSAVTGFNNLSPLTTKGDLVTHDGTNNVRLPVGSNGQVLSADSTQANGLKWISPVNGTVTSVSSANSYLTVSNGSTTPSLTLNVGTAANTVAAGNDSRFADSRAPNGAAGGDLSGTYPNPSVAKLQGTAVSATGPTSGQFLNYNGTNWAGKNIVLTDLKSSVAGNLFPAAACAANETLKWSSVPDQFVCASIASLDAAAITTGTIAAARLPSSATTWSVSGSTVYYSGGSVGIGTSAPTQMLHVNGGIRSAYGEPTAGNTSAAGFSFDGDTGVFSPSDGLMNFWSNNVKTMTVSQGKIGIGTQTPRGALDVVGAIRATAGVPNSADSSSTGISFENNGDTGLFLSNWDGTSSTGDLNVYMNNSPRMTFLASGALVGIGTTTPIFPLDVPGNVGVGSRLYMDRDGSGNSYLRARGTDAEPAPLALGLHSTATGTVDKLMFNTSGVQRMTIDSAGSVGIGTTTPTAPLDVTGNSGWIRVQQSSPDVNGAAMGFFKTRGTTSSPTAVAAGDRIMGLYGSGYTSAGAFSGNVGAVQILASENFTSSAQGSKIDFGTTPIGTTARITRMTIDDAGKVGIGTATPAGNLEVANPNGDSILNVYGKDTNQAGINVGVSQFNRWIMLQETAGANRVLNFWRDHTGVGGNSGTAMAINDSGNVGIGTVSPTAKLHVTGNAPVVSIQDTTNSGTAAYATLKFFDAAGTLQHLIGKANGTNNVLHVFNYIGDVNVMGTGGSCYVNTGGCASDIRLKKNITPIESSLNKILSLSGYQYQWKDPKMSQKPMLGVIAQEVEKVFPDLVETHEDGFKAVRYTGFVAPLIESTKELYGMCKASEQQIGKIERRVASLENENAQLKDQNKKLQEDMSLMKSYLCGKDPSAAFCQKK